MDRQTLFGNVGVVEDHENDHLRNARLKARRCGSEGNKQETPHRLKILHGEAPGFIGNQKRKKTLGFATVEYRASL